MGSFRFLLTTVCLRDRDYAAWYEEDQVGEFRDELEVWIGGDPGSRQEAYASRSGITLVENLLTPLLIVHGTGDLRVPVEQADQYMRRAARAGKESLVELVELQGVGSQDHLEHLSQQQQTWLQAMISKHLRSHKRDPNCPLPVGLLLPVISRQNVSVLF